MSGPDHDHDESSEDELDPDEPRTPLWLPLLGLCLFVSVLVYALVTQKPPAEQPAPAASGSAAAAPPAPANP